MYTHRAKFVGRSQAWLGRIMLLVAIVVCQFPLTTTLAQAQSTPTSINAPLDTVITDCSNDTQLRAALNVAGPLTITFNCGTGAHTIPISSYMEIPGTVTVDGGNQITLDGGFTTPLLQIFAAGNATLKNITLSNGLYNGIHVVDNVGKLTLIHVEVSHNISDGPGGAVYNDINATLIVSDSRFIDNASASTSTTTRGAAIHSVGRATVYNSLFESNRIAGSIGSGGAIGVYGGQFSIDQSRFATNSALDGGALLVDAGTIVTVTSSVFENNQAGYGGAIESSGELQLDYSHLLYNRAINEGGAVWVLGGDLDVTYSTFDNNQSNGNGGAISCYSNTVSIIHSTLSNNRAATHGGALYSTCNINMLNTTIHANAANIGGSGGAGGGIYMEGGGFGAINHTTITSNTASFGEGVYNDNVGGSSLTLQASLLADNGAANCDGVIDSNGYNLSSDTNCGNFVQTGDQQNVKLPLGPLQSNGGPTWTRIPAPTNVAINAIPIGDCIATLDQRDVARPKFGACDIGAVEVFYSNYLPKLRR